MIGIFNILYSNYRFSIGLNFKEFFLFQLYTLGVGFFPIIFSMMLKFTHLLRSNVQTAENLSLGLSKAQGLSAQKNSTKLHIHSELKKDDLEIYAEELVYAETADNYIAVYHLVDGKLQKTMVRSTLSRLETDVADLQNLVRCHRAFLVNLDLLESFKGNAQGLQLRLKYTENTIPVSRKMVAKIKEMLG
jgi:DNA-binding LytR/AlgR family response regulator